MKNKKKLTTDEINNIVQEKVGVFRQLVFEKYVMNNTNCSPESEYNLKNEIYLDYIKFSNDYISTDKYLNQPVFLESFKIYLEANKKHKQRLEKINILSEIVKLNKKIKKLKKIIKKLKN